MAKVAKSTMILTSLPKDIFAIILKFSDESSCDNIKKVCMRLYRLHKRFVTSVIFEQKNQSKVKINEVPRCISHYYKINSIEFRNGVYPSLPCIEVLKHPKWLKKLSLYVPVNISFMKLVSQKCKNITNIVLDYDYFDDERVSYALKLSKLEVIEINCSKVNDDGFTGIGKLNALKSVTVKGCSNLTDNFIRKLSCIKNLQELSISGAPKISSAAFITLKNIKTLKYIHLEGIDSLDEESVQDLREVLGNKIEIDFKKGEGSFWGGMLSSFIKGKGLSGF